MDAKEIAKLVDEGVTLDATTRGQYKRLSDIKRLLTTEAQAREAEHQPGKKGGKMLTFAGKKGSVTVTFPDPSLTSPDADSIKSVRELAGDAFSKLFEREEIYRPVKGFRDLLGGLLKKVPARKILALCQSESAPRVSFAAAS